MDQSTTRRGFLREGTVVAAGIAAASSEPSTSRGGPAISTTGGEDLSYPRDRPGPGGPLGSPTDRGKLVPGLRAPGLPPVPVSTPASPRLPHVVRNGAKEFHLTAQPVKREFLPHMFMDVWGFNGHMPGPLIETTQGDRVRIIVENQLPEPTAIHW